MKKGIYPYEYIEDWKKISETLLPRKEKIFTAIQTWKIVLMYITDTHKTFRKTLR